MSLPVNSTVDPGEVTTKRKRDVENAGKVGLEEMHHPERAKECAQSNPCAGAQQGGQNDKIKGVHLRQAEERFRVQPLPHMTSRRPNSAQRIPTRVSSVGSRAKMAFKASGVPRHR